MLIKKEAKERRALIIDGDNLLHRAHWIGKYHPLTNSKGEDVTDIYTALRMVKSYADQFSVTSIYIVWDKKLLWPSTNFRKQNLVEYKADRNEEQIKEVHSSEQDLTQALKYLGCKIMYPRVMEADDVISWLTQVLHEKIIIVSSDADLYQLVNDQVQVYNAIKKIIVTPENFEKVIGVEQKDFILYKAIKGDESDCIKGLHGYGPAKTKKLIVSLKNGQNPLSEEQLQIVNRNTTLVDLSIGYNVHEGEIEVYWNQYNNQRNTSSSKEEFKEFCERWEFPSILKNFDDWIGTFK